MQACSCMRVCAIPFKTLRSSCSVIAFYHFHEFNDYSIQEDKTRKRRFKRSGFRTNNDSIIDVDQPNYEEKEKLSLLERFFKYRSSLVAPAYFFVKMLYFVNAIGQLHLMQMFLGFGLDNKAFGLHVLENMLRGEDWQATLIFPRVAFCYAKVKNLGSRDNAVTAQCALPVNMLNEKIYIFLWWWILLAACLTFLSAICWLFKLFGRMNNTAYVRRSLQMSTGIRWSNDAVCLFTTKFLRHDGIFVVRIIASNAGDLVASDLLRVLWSHFRERREEGKVDPLTNHARTLAQSIIMPTFPPDEKPVTTFLKIINDEATENLLPSHPLDFQRTKRMSAV